MPRYYCDYCDTYLTHDSQAGRKQHNRGWKHRENVKQYYEQYLNEGNPAGDFVPGAWLRAPPGRGPPPMNMGGGGGGFHPRGPPRGPYGGPPGAGPGRQPPFLPPGQGFPQGGPRGPPGGAPGAGRGPPPPGPYGHFARPGAPPGSLGAPRGPPGPPPGPPGRGPPGGYGMPQGNGASYPMRTAATN